MARDKGKLDTQLSAIVDRIIDEVSAYDSASCYLSLNPDALPAPNPGDFICVVAPTSGSFDGGLFMGGGVEQVTCEAGVVVKVHSPVQLDETHRDAEFLTNSSLGLIENVRLVMKALTDWSPVDGSSDDITRDPLSPASITFTRQSRSLGGCEVVFHTLMDWDLS